jgi:predicted HD superfamily hydrolase involved in NAD metabolism
MMGNSLLSSILRDRVLVWLSDHVPPHRLRHILGVEQMAGELAMCHNVDVAKAQMAGLMHDLAKYFKPPILLEMARAEGLELDSVVETVPHLLHADVSALVARNEFGVQDEDILVRFV